MMPSFFPHFTPIAIKYTPTPKNIFLKCSLYLNTVELLIKRYEPIY